MHGSRSADATGVVLLECNKEVQYPGGLLNHAAPQEATTKPFKPLMVYGKKGKMKGRQVVMSNPHGKRQKEAPSGKVSGSCMWIT